MRKRIIGMSVMIAVLTMLCTQAVVAQPLVSLYVWTDKPQYSPGEKGRLKISILNEQTDPIEIYNISVTYPWKIYDAEKDEWLGNDTIKGDAAILETLTSKGTEDDHYYQEVEFTVPSDGRAIMGTRVRIGYWTSDPDSEHARWDSEEAHILVAALSSPMSIVGLDTWLMSMIAAVVVCTIILAIVIFLATRGAQTSMTRVPASSRAKAA